MGRLSEQIHSDCCGSLLGAAEKQILIAEVAELERKMHLKEREVLALEDEILALHDQLEAVSRRVFYRVYNGAESPDVAWSALREQLVGGTGKSS